MGGRNSRGFTILETMLFLAITGALVVALLVGVTGSINTQRYRDSVLSFKTLLQDQYTELGNVFNGRSGNWRCETDGTITEVTDGTAEQRGQSDCVLLGRYISIVNDTITTANVIGRAPDRITAVGNDINILKTNYSLGVSSVDVQTSPMEWGTALAWPRNISSAQRSIAILLVRAPTSGTTYTFTSDTVPALDDVTNSSLQAMIIEGDRTPGQAQQRLCIRSNGLVSDDAQLGVVINRFATNASGIETRSNEMGDADRC